jgi:PAS domain S-box-containing protein
MDRSPAARYTIAVIAALLAVALRVALNPWLGHRTLFVTVFVTGVLLAWTFGLGPALTGLGTGAAGIALSLLHPVGSLAIERDDDQVTLVAFLVTGVLTTLLVDATRRSRIRAQQAAERATRDREVLESVTDNTSVLLTQCSRELRYLFANRACAEFLGLPRERIVGQEIRAVLGEAAFETIRPHVEAVLRGETVEFESSVPYQGAGPRVMHGRYVPDRGQGGEVRGWFASLSDVTEQKRIERVLREADRRKDEFLATLGHELRNPLAPIANAVQLLQLKGGGSDPELFAARDMIARQVRQLARLIDDLLDVSRITLGKLELRSEKVELAEVVALALETVRPVLRSRGHDLLVLLPPETVWLKADAARLAQVLSNLLDNAAKYSDRPGRITLSATVEARDASARLWIRVKDEGLGIPAELLPRLFEKFTQGPPRPGAAPAGMGLGLALVRGLVEMHGGTVRARSEGPGRGSEFIVELPVSDAPPAPRPPAGAAPLARASDSRRILVVDDNRDSADSLAQLLRVLGHDVEAVHGGHEAVAAAERYRPQLVLMDLGMPELNGYEACRLIREKPWGRAMVLVAQTGWGQDQDRLRAQEAGFDSHLVKPVDAKSLSALLASLPASG